MKAESVPWGWTLVCEKAVKGARHPSPQLAYCSAGVNSHWHKGWEKARAEVFGCRFIFFRVALWRKEPNFVRGFPQFRKSQPSPMLLSTIWIGNRAEGPGATFSTLTQWCPREPRVFFQAVPVGKRQQRLKSAPHVADAFGARREVVEGSWESWQVSHFWQFCDTFLSFRIWLCRRKTCRFLLEVFLIYHLGPLWLSWAGNVEHLLPVGSQARRSSWGRSCSSIRAGLFSVVLIGFALLQVTETTSSIPGTSYHSSTKQVHWQPWTSADRSPSQIPSQPGAPIPAAEFV